MKKFAQNLSRKLVFVALSVALFASVALAQNIKLSLDASDAPKNIFRVRETIDAPAAGKLTLFYPKWIPGEHAPTGMLNDLINLFVAADGKPLEWRRDDVEMFAFHVDVPAGARQLEVSFDYVSQSGTIATANLARIKWNRLVMYPRGAKSDDVQVTASIRLPADWKFATALPVAKETGSAVEFKPVNLTTFVDSPAIIGRYFAKIPLGTVNGAPVEMDLAAENAEALEYQSETLAGWKNLVAQGNLMFGARHYNSYYFLTTLSDDGGDEGLEHHESSENGVGAGALGDESALDDLNELLGHEYAHSWNGKYRRPAALTTPDFEQPMHGELLWVYEGLTQYLGYVLAARSGLWSEEDFRRSLADTAAQMDFQSGRRWRPLVDTSRAVQFTYPSPFMWRNARRGVDYYYEGALVWMDADITIREKSGGKSSLDDFLRRFHGGQNTGAAVKTYDFEEIVRTLNEVLPFDWRGFFIERVYKIQKNAPLGGITNGGWRLVYEDSTRADELLISGNHRYSIGVNVSFDGEILDINPELAAGKAGLAPAMYIKTINGASFSTNILYKAIAATKDRESPLTIEASTGSVTRTYTINYKGGAKYPQLVRDPSKTDYLSGVIKPLSNIPPRFIPSSEPHSVLFQVLPGRPRNKNADNSRPFANVTKVLLSQSEIFTICSSNLSTCSSEKQTINISVEGKSNDPTDVLTYNYTVSGGKIIGQGTNVVWDLSGVKLGIYYITVGADNGCGICGVTKTMEVKVTECPNCN